MLPFIRGVLSLLVATILSEYVRERLVYAVHDGAGVFPDRLRHHGPATCACQQKATSAKQIAHVTKVRA